MVFGVVLINGDIHIYLRLTAVAMATKFGTKLAITRLCVRKFCEIFAPIGVLRRWAIECC